MLILTNTNIVVMVLDSIRVNNFHGQTVSGVKMLLLLLLMWAHLCMLIIKKDILVVCEGPTQELDDTTITAEANILLILQNHEKDLC